MVVNILSIIDRAEAKCSVTVQQYWDLILINNSLKTTDLIKKKKVTVTELFTQLICGQNTFLLVHLYDYVIESFN